MPRQILTLKVDGKPKKVVWDKDRDPTNDELEALADGPDYQESKPGFFQGVRDIVIDPIMETGRTSLKHLKEGNYPAAFHDIAAPVLKPFEGIQDYLGGEKPKAPGTELLETSGVPYSQMKGAWDSGQYSRLAGQGLTSLAMLGLSARGMLKERANTVSEGTRSTSVNKPTIDPTALSDKFKGEFSAVGEEKFADKPIYPSTLEKMYEHVRENKGRAPKINLNEFPQELPFEFEDTSIQPDLKINKTTAGMGVRSPQIDLFESSIPDSLKTSTEGAYAETGGPRQRELFTPKELHQTEIRPMILEPRFMGATRPTWARLAEQKDLPFDYDTIGAAETSPIPEVAKAAKQVVESELAKPPTIFDRKSGYTNPGKTQGTFSRLADDFFTSNYTVLVRDSPAGKSIANLIDKYRAETGRISGEIAANLKDVVNPLDKNQYTEFQQLLDKGGDSQDPMVSIALGVARDIDTRFTQRVVNSGMHLKTPDGKMIPFVGKENYWPRMYDPAMFADKPAFIERLIKQGLSPEAAAKAVGNARRFGERLIDPQNARVLDLPEHRKDFGALLKHYDDMAHRVAASEILGVKDIADPNTPISQLVSQTRDPSRVTKILTQYLDREGGVAPYEADAVKKISKFTTAFYLSKFAISNANQLAFVPVVTNFSSTGKAVAKFLRNPQKTWREAEATGALQTVMQEAIRETGGESPISKMFGIKASEGSNRTISAIAGKYYIQDLFNKFQKNPNNARLRSSLEDLTLENGDVLLKQPALTDKQVAYGATRVVEKTQGRAQSIDLPYNWDRSPYISLLLLYKKYAFVQGKLVKDAIKANPGRNIPLLLALFGATGEVTGDMKAAISGMITGDQQQAIENRGQAVQSPNKILNRMVQNYLDAMFIGLAGDVLNSTMSGKQSMYQTAVGPVASLPIEIGGNMVSDAKNARAVTRNPNKSQTLQGLASHIPYVGSAVRRKMRERSKF